ELARGSWAHSESVPLRGVTSEANEAGMFLGKRKFANAGMGPRCRMDDEPRVAARWFRRALLAWFCTAIGSWSVQAATVVQVNAATPQSPQTSASVAYSKAQTAGNANILAIGWNDATSNITSVKDTVGNTYRLAVATARGSALSQAIYYASNI